MGERRLEMAGGGELSLEQLGSRVRFDARRRADDRGLYKVWLLGEGRARLLLGTLAPEGGELRLRRTLSVGQLEQAGCWPAAGAEVLLAFSFGGEGEWYCEGSPARLVKDVLLRQVLTRPMLCRRTASGFELAAPFRRDSPVALNTLLCLARVETVKGSLHLIWDFDSGGRPKNRKI